MYIVVVGIVVTVISGISIAMKSGDPKDLAPLFKQVAGSALCVTGAGPLYLLSRYYLWLSQLVMQQNDCTKLGNSLRPNDSKKIISQLNGWEKLLNKKKWKEKE